MSTALIEDEGAQDRRQALAEDKPRGQPREAEPRRHALDNAKHAPLCLAAECGARCSSWDTAWRHFLGLRRREGVKESVRLRVS